MAVACCVLGGILSAGTLRAEEAAVRAERFDGLVESLNATSERRSRVLELIYNELRGPDSREMQEVLREALSRRNSLILQGVAEAMAMLGDSRDVSSLETLLATNRQLEVKTLVIRLLPAFCLGGSERARFNYIRYASGWERVVEPVVLEPLRRPPLTRRGRLDTAQERMQTRVARIIAGQFDPVGVALRFLDDRLYGQAARETVIYYVGNSLGNDPAQWTPVWNSQGGNSSYRVPDEVEEIRLAALQSLSDMGAEGLPELLGAFRRLLSDGGGVLEQAAYDTMAVMCRSAFEDYGVLKEMHFGLEDAVEAENWRARRLGSAAALILFASENAGASLSRSASDAEFGSAAECLGSALAFPDNFPDPDGDLASARVRGVSLLERMLMMPDLTRDQRSSVAVALGTVGEKRAVRAVVDLIASPYCSPETGADGMRMAESCIEALRLAAVGSHNGNAAAREALLDLLADTRMFPPLRPGTPPVGIAHMVLWRLQRLAKSNETSLAADGWRMRLGWQEQ